MTDVNDLTRQRFRVGGAFHDQFLGTDQPAILPRQADRLAAVLTDEADDLLVHQSAKHHFHHVHGLAVSDAHAFDETAFLADALQEFADLRPATVDHNRIHADEFHQYHVARESLLQVLVNHGIATILDDDGFASEALNIRQCLYQDLCALACGFRRKCHMQASYRISSVKSAREQRLRLRATWPQKERPHERPSLNAYVIVRL